MRRPFRTAALALLAAATAACGGSPTAAPAVSEDAAGATRVDRAEVTFRLPGETATLSATAGGRTTAAPTLALVSETRYLHDLPVLDAAALAAGALRAVAPGTATVDVRAFGAAPARVTVRFQPSRPLVLSAAPASASGAGDTVALRGWGMRALAGREVRVGSVRAVALGGDSATLRLAVPPLAAGACRSGALSEPVGVADADVAEGVAVPRRREGDLALAVGRPARLSAEAARCLRLAPIPGARYALAFLDARQVRRAAEGFEGVPGGPSTYAVTVAEAGQAAPSAAMVPGPSASRAAAPDHVVRSASSAGTGDPARRDRPWTEGERFELRDPSLAAPLRARVVRVHGGHLVFAIAEGEEAEGGTEAWVARADSAFARLAAEGYPVFRKTLSPTLPVTSAGSGQLLVVARRDAGAWLGSSAVVAAEGRRLSYAFVNTAYTFTAAGLLRTLAHEVAHAWQEQYAADLGAPGTGAAAWATEGTADLLAWSVVGRALGVGLTANWEWAVALADPGRAAYALLPAVTRGDLTAGYASAAGFGHDLVARLVRGGVDEDEALAAVVRGALEGWEGWNRFGARREGLARRMRRALGAGWTPSDALLGWTLAQAADDLTDAPELQNHAFARVSTAGHAAGLGWLAPATLRTGAAALREDPAASASVAGNAARVSTRYGSPNYVRIEDEGRGGAYTLDAAWNGAPLTEVEWMIVRYR